jgi:prepilin-type N-terminal cleavage/methylation domain-containing protein
MFGFRVYHNDDGFSLTEVALCLVVMGVVLSFGIPSFLQYLRYQRTHETKDKQEKILQSLGGFVLQNGYLPLPADPFASPENFGVARESAVNPPDMIGILPFKTLGLPDSYAQDGFKRYFTYAGGTSSDHPKDFHGSFCTAKNFFPLQLFEKLSLTHSPFLRGSESDPVAVILVSHGENGYGAYYGMPGHILKRTEITPKGKDEIENAASKLSFIQRAFSGAKDDYFDDMVVWVTRSNLMALYAKSPCAPNLQLNQQRPIFL